MNTALTRATAKGYHIGPGYRRLLRRYQAVRLAENGADFRDVYRFFLDAHGERDAYQQSARVFRGSAQKRRLVISARDSHDLNKRPLTFEWKILRGDASRLPRTNDGGLGARDRPCRSFRRSPERPGHDPQRSRQMELESLNWTFVIDVFLYRKFRGIGWL